MKTILFIINPISGTGKHQSVVVGLTEMLNRDFYDYSLAFTEGPGHATELSKEASQEGVDIVVAVGGDGTMHEVARGIIGTPTALGILPRGSGNGLARNLQIPMKLKGAIDVINSGHIISIDTIEVNGTPFVGIAGVGFDALIAWKFAHYGKRGMQSYVKIVLNEFTKYKSDIYNLEIDGENYKEEAFMLSFANSSQFGNNAVISPNASIDDGLLDVCLMKEFPTHLAPIIAMRMFSNSMDRSRYMKILQGKEVYVHKDSPYIHLDGEPIKMDNELFFQVIPSSLKMVVPLSFVE